MRKPWMVILSILLFSSLGFTKSELPIATQNLLIQKLTSVVQTLPDDADAKTKVTLRLADLHAERGRSLAKADLEAGCVQCVKGKVDREQAVAYYKEALPKLKGEPKQQVLTHMGHLYELLGDTGEAKDLYRDVAKTQDNAGEALFSLAEIQFKNRNYVKAQANFTKALADAKFPRRGLATYRLAWCQYNQGKVSDGIATAERILSNPKLLNRNGSGAQQADVDFQGEVAKDYTVFISHSGNIQPKNIARVFELSPQASRLENVTFLAKELERLGQNAGAMEAWKMVIGKTTRPMDRTEGLVYLAGLELKAKQNENALQSLEKALRNYQTAGRCETDQCVELKKRLRQVVLDWNRIEVKAPSKELQKAYVAYLGFAPKDDESLDLAIQVAILRDDFAQAKTWNDQWLALQKSAGTPQKVERGLLRGLEIAEASKDPLSLSQAQTQYLAQSPLKGKSFDIRYNMANQQYEDKKYEAAGAAFDSLARNPKAPRKLALQSAELAMDVMVLLKKDTQIELMANDYARIFPKENTRFRDMGQKSVLSQTAKLSAGDSTALASAWTTLSRFQPQHASSEEKTTYFKNRIILGRKLKKYPEVAGAVDQLLSVKGISVEDRKFALENKVFISELRLDFRSAFKAYSQLKTNKWLEMARLADLAEKEARSYYLSYLKGDADPATAKAICERLIREAGSFEGRNKVCLNHIKSDKNLVAQLFLEMHAKKPNLKKGLATVKRFGLEATAVGRILQRDKWLQKENSNLAKLAAHKLDSRAERVARSIQSRGALLARTEKATARAIATTDWYLQVFALTKLKEESLRFYQDLLALPQPEGLTPEEQQQYLGLLSQQATPYKNKADALAMKLGDLWSQENAMDQLVADFHNSSLEVQKLIGPQIDDIRTLAPETKKNFIFTAFRKPPVSRLPSLANLEKARAEVVSRPHDSSALKNLLQLERARGHQPTIQYLQGRIKNAGAVL